MKTYIFPGQGSQHIGMGAELFEAFPDITATADAILGYSIRQLCLSDAERQLGQTRFTQPALFVVNALTYRRHLQQDSIPADFVAGHSLGEYNALESAGVISFEDGLRLVQKRGELMSRAPKGAMAAVIGIDAERVAGILRDNRLDAIDIANYNSHNQTIISGLQADISNAQTLFEQHQAMYLPLNVSGAFHSRYMQDARTEFAGFLQGFRFAPPRVPVIANVDAQAYDAGNIAARLADQLTHSVRWLDSIHYLLNQGASEFIELGPGDVLSKLVRSIRSKYVPQATVAAAETPTPAPASTAKSAYQLVDEWNRHYPVGTAVSASGYTGQFITKSQATVLFGHRAAIYLNGYNGYFALNEVQPAAGGRAAA